MRLKKIIKLYENNSVSVCGMKGRGKDLLTSNIVIRRALPYISNVNYGGKYIPFEYEKIKIGNSYDDFIEGKLSKYIYPYKDKTDIYLSDCGVYFPSQYCNELNKKYRDLPLFMALSRQLGDCAVHTNSQSLGRVYDKIREMSDIYILANRCIYIKGIDIVIQKITIYDKYESAMERRKPLKIPLPIFANKEMRLNRKIRIAEYEAQHGIIKEGILVYKNKSNYNTRIFKEMLENGKE